MEAPSAFARNDALRRQVLLMAAAGCAIVLAAWFFSGGTCALWCAFAVAVAGGMHVAFSIRRYHEIARLAAEVDEVLHSGRRVSFSDCKEGDVSVLRNELSKMTAQLMRMADQLEHEKLALADAMADISHQIRTPLTAMALMLPALERDDSASVRKRTVRDLETLLDRVSWLVTSLLKMAKVDAGALSIDMRTVRAADVVGRAVHPLEMICDLHDVRLCLECPDEVSFCGDARWTAEALENIVKNCVEHTPAGGTITVSASEDALAARIIVEDTGCGIAPEDLPHVFERFYRGASEPAGDGADGAPEGFGIGLALAQSLICAQGGTLRARNALGGGARFEIAFPKLIV